MRKGMLPTIFGGLITIVSWGALSGIRAACDQGVVTWTGLIGTLQRLNNEANKQLCLQQSLGSPAALFLFVGIGVVVLGIFRLAKSRAENLEIPMLSGNSFCGACGVRLNSESKFCSKCGSKVA